MSGDETAGSQPEVRDRDALGLASRALAEVMALKEKVNTLDGVQAGFDLQLRDVAGDSQLLEQELGKLRGSVSHHSAKLADVERELRHCRPAWFVPAGSGVTKEELVGEAGKVVPSIVKRQVCNVKQEITDAEVEHGTGFTRFVGLAPDVFSHLRCHMRAAELQGNVGKTHIEVTIAEPAQMRDLRPGAATGGPGTDQHDGGAGGVQGLSARPSV